MTLLLCILEEEVDDLQGTKVQNSHLGFPLKFQVWDLVPQEEESAPAYCFCVSPIGLVEVYWNLKQMPFSPG